MHFLEFEGLLVELGLLADALELPRSNVGEVGVVAQRFAVGRLAFLAEVSATRFPPVQGVERQQLGELEIVSYAAGIFETLVEVVAGTGHRDVVPELLAEAGNSGQRVLKAGFGPRHPNVVPHDAAELAVDLADAAAALYGEQLVDLVLRVARGLLEGVVVGRDLRERRV